MTEEDLDFLQLFPSQEPNTFTEMCSSLGGDCPDDKEGWRDLFARIKNFERDGYMEVERRDGKIEGIMLTPSGAALIRDRLDRARGLLSIEGV